jgi:phosphoglycerate dehydrogenase-like enzyme
MTVTGVNRSGQSDEACIAKVGRFQDMDAMIADADVVVLAVALTDETVDLVDEHRLRSMKDDAILVNVARGRVVNQAALYAHLLAHPTFHACIDVWWEEPFNEGRFHLEYPFFDLSNLIGTPHCASRVPAMPGIMARAASESVQHFLQTGEPRQRSNTAQRR